MPAVTSITIHSSTNILIYWKSFGAIFLLPNSSSWEIKKDRCFFLRAAEWVFSLRSESKEQYLCRAGHYSHSSRHFFCICNGSSFREIEPQYFSKSIPIDFTFLFFSISIISSLDAPFFIVVTMLISLNQIYQKKWMLDKRRNIAIKGIRIVSFCYYSSQSVNLRQKILLNYHSIAPNILFGNFCNDELVNKSRSMLFRCPIWNAKAVPPANMNSWKTGSTINFFRSSSVCFSTVPSCSILVVLFWVRIDYIQTIGLFRWSREFVLLPV